MAIAYQPLESKSGFKSPGFIVDEAGNVTVNGEFRTTQEFKVNGVQVIDDTDSVVSLGESIRASYLTRLGTLEFLNIDGDFTIAQGSSPYFSVINGHIEMESFQDVGRIDNVELGLKTPAPASFTTVNIGPGDSTGELTVQGNMLVTGTSVVGPLVNVGGIAVSGVLSSTEQPTAVSHLTRKDYVDNRISALAIALGG
jgi:hypothetical protein